LIASGPASQDTHSATTIEALPSAASSESRKQMSSTLIQAVQATLREEMERNPAVVVLGEDIAKNGGVFRATEGLLDRFGEARVIDTPLNESGIIGVAIGMAMNGLRPVAEIQFADFVYPAFDQIVSELAKMRYRSGGAFTCPVVVRMPYGGGIRGGGYHSQSPEAYFVHTAGLHVYAPATPTDARGLLRAAIRGADPVIFLEPKRVYRTVKEELPDDPDFTVEPGRARVAREGSHVALISYGAMVHTCLEAAEKAAASGIECRVLDLRTLVPMDVDAIVAAARDCGRVVVVHEAPKTCGVGAEIAALVAERAIESLEAPVLRVTGFDTPFPYALEHVYLPSADRVVAAVEKVARF
jgi:pyruvate dehydrogenase E1 component beta subunit